MPRVADAWTLLTDDPRERATFAGLAATLALPSAPAGPKNRLRDVVRIATPHGTYFLKRFRRTQLGNRLRFLLTRPRAADDAARECAMTQALGAAGERAPRPVAIGRRGPASFYLCAELAGEPLATALARRVDGALLRRAAAHAGRLLARGFALPDLSADHVFVAADGGFGVLDLHNGALRAPGGVAARTLRRVLRRSRKSLRDVAVPPALALRAAATLLAAAGCPRARRRALLAAEPPWSTAARYDAPGKSDAYAGRNPARTARELALLRAVWPGRPGDLVVDLPCGAGRLLPLLADELQCRVVQCDASLAMLRQAHARAPSVPRAQGDALAPPFRAGAAAGVVCFRFLHHLPAGDSDRAIAACCALARDFVVVSFFHPASAHAVRRTIAGWFGRASRRHARTLAALDRSFAAQGFARAAHAAERPFARDLWVAAYRRTPSGA